MTSNICVFLLSAILVFAHPLWGQEGTPVAAPQGPARTANSNPLYQQLRQVGLSGEGVAVNGLLLKRDEAALTLESGTLCFLAPVEGMVTGAVFRGSGKLTLTPPLPEEQRNLAILTGGQPFQEEFSEAVLRFTDGTYKEVTAGGSGTSGSCNEGSLLERINGHLRDKVKYNLAARLLQDVISGRPGGFFAAFIKGKKYSENLLYAIDPTVGPLAMTWDPEDVTLTVYDDYEKSGTWTSYHLAGEYQGRQAPHHARAIDIESQDLEVTIQKNGEVEGVAVTRFRAESDGLQVVPLDLFPTLRVSSVSDESGAQLDFIQEDKDADAQFAVILPRALKAGENFLLRTAYKGKDAVSSEGGGNYYPVARSNWYPFNGMEDYAVYDMRFAIPKGMDLVATGELVQADKEGDQMVSHWKSREAQTVAGFHFGRFKSKESDLQKLGIHITAYANEHLPDFIRGFQSAGSLPREGSAGPVNTMGTMTTTGMLKKAVAEAELALPLYSDYFGPISQKQIAITQQVALDYGQAWPGLVWLPMSYFYDSTVRHQIGMDDPRGYFRIVGPHELSHQWWGHHVAWASYRDQWMSEGFAELSASLFLQVIDTDDFNRFWDDELELLTQKNKQGARAIDVGPVTLGYRLGNRRTGFDIPRNLIYPKGGYILHMLRMLMWDPRNGDAAFKAMMHDFVSSYAHKPASTEDFKAVVERHMTPGMDLERNKRMDWFFGQFVYGTALPHYRLNSSTTRDGSGTPVLSLELGQSNVSDDFVMAVPLYVEMNDGKVLRLGAVRIAGNNTLRQNVPLQGWKEPPKRVLLNYYHDVMCTMDAN